MRLAGCSAPSILNDNTAMDYLLTIRFGGQQLPIRYSVNFRDYFFSQNVFKAKQVQTFYISFLNADKSITLKYFSSQ